jgi:hypothetical protein
MQFLPILLHVQKIAFAGDATSASGPSLTTIYRSPMSAFGGKANITKISAYGPADIEEAANRAALPRIPFFNDGGYTYLVIVTVAEAHAHPRNSRCRGRPEQDRDPACNQFWKDSGFSGR